MAITLTEAKEERNDLKSAIAQHKAECPQCGSTARGRNRPAKCIPGATLIARHQAIVKDIKEWFAPGRDQETLI
jgi:hypothetical protein